MSLKPQLMNAILSMDAYSRGYNASINTLPSDGMNARLGNAKIIADSRIFQSGVDRLDDNIGFYALAYDLNNDGKADIISYRGTDYPKAVNEKFGDPIHGWTLGAGDLRSEQGRMAVEFYKEIAGPGNYFTSNITLTGHSLGGGLAGFVGALYDKNAYTYDSMTYELSVARATNYTVQYRDSSGHMDTMAISPNGFANFSSFYPGYTLLSWAYQNPDYVQLVYGGNSPIQPDYNGIQGYYVQGEALQGLLGRGMREFITLL